MLESEGPMTLIGRKETHGRRYPGLLEKMILLILVVVAVMVGQWMWTESDWPTLALLSATICGLPLGTLILTEVLSRIVQTIHVNAE